MVEQKRNIKPFYAELNSFRTVNTRDNAVTMKDDECPILLNLMPIGTSLYSVPGYSAVLAQTPAGTTIVRIFEVVLGGDPYKIVATSDGACYKFNAAWTRTEIAPAGTFTGSSEGPYFAEWKFTNLLIIDPNGYWDYSLGGGLVKHTTLDAPLRGKAIAVWQARVWIGGYGATARTIQSSAPDSFTNFQLADGGTINVDYFSSLRHSILSFVDTQDFLYVVGDHATHVIYGVQMLANGQTAFNLTDAVPGVGTPYSETVQVLGDAIYLTSNVGVFVISGGAHEVIGSLLDGMFPKIDFSFKPIGFFSKIFNKQCYCVLFYVTSPLDGMKQKWLACFYEGRWFFTFHGVVGQGPGIDFVFAGEKKTSDDTETYAAYGNNIVQLFTGATNITKKARTKSTNFGLPIHDKQILRVGALLSSREAFLTQFTARMQIYSNIDGAATTITFYPNLITWTEDDGTPISWIVSESDPRELSWTAEGGETMGMSSCDGRGKRLAIDFEETSSNAYVLNGFSVEGQVGPDW